MSFDPIKCAERVLSSNKVAQCCDAQGTNEIIQRDILELLLNSTLTLAHARYRWLSNGVQRGNHLCVMGYSVVVKPYTLSYRVINDALKANTANLKDAVDGLKDSVGLFDGIQKQMDAFVNQFQLHFQKQSLLWNYSQQVNCWNMELARHIRNIREQGACLLAPLRREIGTILLGRMPIQMSLLELYAKSRNWADGNHLQRLKEVFDVSDDPFAPPPIDGRSGLKPVYAPFFDPTPRAVFRTLEGQEIGSILFDYSPDMSCVRLLPMTWWSRFGGEQPKAFRIPFAKPYPIYNAGLLPGNRDAKIMLTPHLELACTNQLTIQQTQPLQAQESILCSWFGEERTANEVLWRQLEGREVCYLLNAQYGYTIQKIYQIAFTAYMAFKDKVGGVRFIDTTSDPHTILTPAEFLAKANALGATRECAMLANIKKEGNDTMAINDTKDLENIQETAWVVKPVVPENSITMLYAPTGVGKTWLSMSMAYAVTIGADPFQMEGSPLAAAWKTARARKVLYIDSEMGENAFKRRLKKIRKIYNPDGKIDDSRFKFKSVNGLLFNLAEYGGKGQLYIDRALAQITGNRASDLRGVLLVLDNYSTLSSFLDSGKAWLNFFRWLKELRDRGCSIIVVHHAGKDGDQRGSSTKTATCDNVIKLEVPEKDYSGIPMLIEIEKGRDLTEFEKAPLLVSLNPNRGWEALNLEERIDDYIENHYRKTDLKSLALDLEMSETTLKRRMRKLGLRKNDKSKGNTPEDVNDDDDTSDDASANLEDGKER